MNSNQLFECLKTENHIDQDFISVPKMIEILETNGFFADDPRWKPCYEQLLRVNKLDQEHFTKIFAPKMSLLSKVPRASIFCQLLNFVARCCGAS